MSMAPRTACSASSLYGGWRSRKGSRLSDGTIEYSTDELDIFPGGPLPGWIPQQCGGVICNYERHSPVMVRPSAQFSNGRFRIEQRLRRKRAEREHHFRLYQLELPD